jgi:hypothetical protein
MAEWDQASDMCDEYGARAFDILATLLNMGGNEHNYPGFAQAAYFMVECIVPIERHKSSEELYDTARDIITGLRAEIDASTWPRIATDEFKELALKLTAWADQAQAVIEQNRDALGD